MSDIRYVYVRSEPGLYTVGFYDPRGKWQSESDHGDREAAAQRVAALNGDEPLRVLRELERSVSALHAHDLHNGIAPQFRDMHAQVVAARALLEGAP